MALDWRLLSSVYVYSCVTWKQIMADPLFLGLFYLVCTCESTLMVGNISQH